jgi:PPE-repeat protein
VENQLNTDIATGLSTCITKDGQTTPTANIPMGGFRHTGVADPTLVDQYMTVNQAQLGTSALLSGVFTPTDASGAGLVFTSAVGMYRRLPGAVLISMRIVFPATADGSNAKIGSLPFTAANVAFTGFPISALPTGGSTPSATGLVLINTATMSLNKTSGVAMINSELATATLFVNGTYPI